jgi:hypothetical protein
MGKISVVFLKFVDKIWAWAQSGQMFIANHSNHPQRSVGAQCVVKTKGNVSLRWSEAVFGGLLVL